MSNNYKKGWARHQQRWFGKWHVYLGIIAGFIIAVVGITGSLLVFRDEIDQALNPTLFKVLAGQRRMPVEEIMPMVKQAYPKDTFSYVLLPGKNVTEPYIFFNYKKEEQLFVSPYTGQPTGKRLYESSFIHIVTEIHTSLLVPVAGRYIVGISALILLILTITGLRLWIPKKWKQLKTVLTVNFKASFKRQNYDWHNVIGFYTAPFVSLIALTGFCLTFSIVIIPMLFTLSGLPPQGAAKLLGAKSTWQAHAVTMPLDKLYQIKEQELPGSEIAGIAFPADSTGNFRLDIRDKGLPAEGKREMLILDQYSGKVLLNSRKDFPPVAAAYLSWLQPIHFGNFGGIPTKILALLAGMVPLALFITGFIIWYPRWKKQKSRKENIQVDADGEAVQAAPKRAISSTEEAPLKTFPYFGKQLKKGLVYAGWFMLISAIMGAVYGLFAGMPLQPAVFSIAFSTTLVVLNGVVALLCMVVQLLLWPFKRSSRSLNRYLALSLGFVLAFVPVYFLLLNTGWRLF
ncbi:PepSY-associated TM helix domain-containing protein [Filimonas lacunae]|nr:PepSY-associated TM helix domain-containing protein [Filimonas lacunae]